MKLTHSSFYYKEKRTKTVEHNLLKRLEAICMECPGYGYRRVTYQLHRENIKVNHKKVLRLMKENDLLCRMKRRWVKTTQSGHNLRVYPNLVKGLVIDRINQVWLTDITYIRIKKGFVYLAAVLDAYSRRVIGHHPIRRTGYRPRPEGTRDGNKAKETRQWCHSSLRPGNPVCLE